MTTAGRLFPRLGPALHRRLAARLSGKRPGVDLLFREAVCAWMTAALSARRPGAGSVPGRWGGSLGGKDPAGRLRQGTINTPCQGQVIHAERQTYAGSSL